MSVAEAAVSELADKILFRLRTAHRGPKKAISAPELAAIFRTTDRQARAAIRALRLAGKPICGEDIGFYYPTKAAEAEHTVASLKSRRDAIQEVIDGMVKGLDEEFGQPQLFSMEAI